MYRILQNRNKRTKPAIYKKTGTIHRRSKDPLATGKLKEFARLFIWPFVNKYKGDNVSLEAFLECLFSVDERKIERFKVLESFIMPGNLLDYESIIKVRRKTFEGQQLWVRTDIKMPDRIDIELVYKNGQSTTFKLKQAQFSSILRMIGHDPYRCHASVEKDAP